MNNQPQQLDPESLCQLPNVELVKIIIEQALVIEKLQASIKELQEEIQRLRVSRDLDSKTSSSPPSSDLLKKSEKNNPQNEPEANNPKRKPGGQPGHAGKTRKGFGRVDRYELLRPQLCSQCGSQAFAEVPVSVQVQQVAQLVELRIEIVEYQRHSCQCSHCGQVHTAAWPESIVPGQDLGVNLQALKRVAGELWSSAIRKIA